MLQKWFVLSVKRWSLMFADLLWSPSKYKHGSLSPDCLRNCALTLRGRKSQCVSDLTLSELSCAVAIKGVDSIDLY